jgi:hypothetical protein
MSFTSVFPSKFLLFSAKRVISLSFSEAVGALDLGIVKSLTRSLLEFLGLIEAFSKSLSRTLVESIGIYDFGVTKSLTRTYSESIGLYDFGFSKSLSKTFSELLGVIDVSISKSLTRTYSEAIGLYDFGFSKSLSRSLAEALGLTEVFTKQFSKSFVETLGFYEYWGYVYPYYDPRKAVEKLINILLVAKSLGIKIDFVLENPYIVYLIRMMAKKISGEAYA